MARKSQNTNKQGIINRDVNAASRAALALQYRAQRLTFDEIAHKAGYASPGAARNAIQRELQRTMSEKADELRREELDMLNRLHAAIWPLAVPEIDATIEASTKDENDEGHEGTDNVEEAKKKKRSQFAAIDRIIAISDRRSKLMGLDRSKDEIASNVVVIREVPHGYLGVQETKA